MITDSTVFVLGAGASIPFRFPSGATLLAQICSGISGDEVYRESIRAAFDDAEGIRDLKLVEEFGSSLRYCGKSSVDAFLEHRTDYLDVGKAAIGRALVPYENEDDLFDPNNQGNWYKLLFSRMNSEFDKFAENRVAFITYNYDRSLEHFLHRSLQHSHGRTAHECKSKLDGIRIIHLHGTLGSYDFTRRSGRAYHTDPAPSAVRQCRKSIRIISEANEFDQSFTDAIELLHQAERVFFVGFGYDATNISRLKPSYWCVSNKQICGSGYGLSNREIKDREKLFGGGMIIDRSNHDALTFLRHNWGT